MQTFNQVLYEKRIEKGLTIKQAARAIGVFSIALSHAENGYGCLTKKGRKKASEFYGVDLESLYSQTYAYTNPINEKPPAPKKLIKKILNLPNKFWFRVIVVCLLIMSIGSIIVSAILREKATSDQRFFANADYLYLYDTIVEKTPGGVLGEHYYIKEFDNGTANKNQVSIYVNDKDVFSYHINARYINSALNTIYILDYYWEHSLFGDFNFHFGYYDNTKELLPETIYRGYLFRAGEQNFIPIRLFGNSDKEIVSKGEEYNKAIAIAKLYFDQTEDLIAQTFRELGATNSVYNIINDATTALGNVSTNKLAIPLYVSVISFIVIFALLLWCYLPIIINKAKLKTIDEEMQEISFVKSTKTVFKPLPKDVKIFPPIVEGIERFLGLILVALGGLGTVLFSAHSLQVVDYSSPQMQEFISALMQFIPVSFMLLLFHKLNIMSKSKSISVSMLLFIFLGFIFYVLEAMTIGIITYKGLVPKQIKEKLLAFIIPGNFFFGMVTYNLTALFLFYTPKKFTKKRQVTLWRLLSLIPVAYFIVGYILTLLKSKELIVISPYLECIFNANKPIVSIFAFGLLFTRYLITKISYTKYGEENGELFMTGNRYAWIHNLVAVGLFILICVISYIFSKFGIGTGSFNINESKYALILVPLFLLCAQKKQSRSKIGDNFYNVTYGILTVIPILIIMLYSLFVIIDFIFI